MRHLRIAMVASALLVLAAQAANAATVGYTKFTVPAGSDVLVSAPVNRPGYTEFAVQSKTATTLTPTVATGGVFAPTTTTKYYARFTSGTAAGLWSTITADDGTALTLENTDVLGGTANVQAGDTFRIYKHQTISTLFPAKLLNVSFKVGTQVLLFDNVAASQNKAAFRTVTRSGAPLNTWTGADGVNTVIPPDTAFIIRNPSAGPLTCVFVGIAPDHAVSFLVTAGLTKDVLIGSGYPVNRTVFQTKFGGTTGRQILLFDNTALGINKASATTVTYSGFPINNWTGGAGPITTLGAGTGFIFRQNGTGGGIATVTKPY